MNDQSLPEPAHPGAIRPEAAEPGPAGGERARRGGAHAASRGRPGTGGLLVAVIAAIVVAAAVFALVSGPTGSGSPGSHGSHGAAGQQAAPVCERLVVPAYFSPLSWSGVFSGNPAPSDIVLDISGLGAGTAPQPDFSTAVSAAGTAGATVLGYISTEDGQRPLAQAEAEVRNYADWYGVTSIFLDRASGDPAQLGYYRALSRYIRSRDPRGQLWLNPGDYPDRAYMSLGDVVMTFEGTYSQYTGADVPSWVRDYPASRFAHNVYAAPASVLGRVLRLARSRDAGHVYVTDLIGSNPYQALPSYWSAEEDMAAAGCPQARGGPARASAVGSGSGGSGR